MNPPGSRLPRAFCRITSPTPPPGVPGGPNASTPRDIQNCTPSSYQKPAYGRFARAKISSAPSRMAASTTPTHRGSQVRPSLGPSSPWARAPGAGRGRGRRARPPRRCTVPRGSTARAARAAAGTGRAPCDRGGIRTSARRWATAVTLSRSMFAGYAAPRSRTAATAAASIDRLGSDLGGSRDEHLEHEQRGDRGSHDQVVVVPVPDERQDEQRRGRDAQQPELAPAPAMHGRQEGGQHQELQRDEDRVLGRELAPGHPRRQEGQRGGRDPVGGWVVPRR